MTGQPRYTFTEFNSSNPYDEWWNIEHEEEIPDYDVMDDIDE